MSKHTWDALLVVAGIAPSVLAFCWSAFDPTLGHFSLFSRCGALMVLAGVSLEVRRILYALELRWQQEGRLFNMVVDLGEFALTTSQNFNAFADHVIDILDADGKSQAHMSSRSRLSENIKRNSLKIPASTFSQLDIYLSKFGQIATIVGTIIWAFGDWICELVLLGSIRTFLG